jgi:hypothetical protein
MEQRSKLYNVVLSFVICTYFSRNHAFDIAQLGTYHSLDEMMLLNLLGISYGDWELGWYNMVHRTAYPKLSGLLLLHWMD